MANFTRSLFLGLSKNKCLNASAKKWGLRFGAKKFVAGTTVEQVTEVIRDLNAKGIHCTVDHLGEFVSNRSEALKAKAEIIRVLNVIHEENLDSHISVKLTQLGLDIDHDFCLGNMRNILSEAAKYEIFVNIDMEDYSHYQQTLDVLYALRKEYPNVGTAVQAYLFRTIRDLEDLKDVRLRIVKGAYQESPEISYQTKADIDGNFLKIAKQRLLQDTFTSIATHDHHLINELKRFIQEHQINKDKYEFQMLYGFRTELQYELAREGHRFCTYIPFGEDWFGYFMRRLAERPQNLNLVVKDVFYTADDQLKKRPIIAGAATLAMIYIWRKHKKEREER